MQLQRDNVGSSKFSIASTTTTVAAYVGTSSSYVDTWSVENRWSYALRWCWLRRVPIGCYSDLRGPSNSTGRDVGCWRWKAALGARKGFMTTRYELLWVRTKSSDAGVNGQWERGRFPTLRFLSSWWPRTSSALLLRLVTATPRLLKLLNPHLHLSAFIWSRHLKHTKYMCRYLKRRYGYSGSCSCRT